MENLAKRGPLATVQGPLANTRTKREKLSWIRMWIAMLKPYITGK